MKMEKKTLTKNNKCFVIGCTSGYKTNPEKVTLFKAPSSEADRSQWQSYIQRIDKTLTDKDVVCAKHFEKECIVSTKMTKDGVVNLKKCRLIPGSIPTLNLFNESYCPIPFSDDITVKIEPLCEPLDYVSVKTEPMNEWDCSLLFQNIFENFHLLGSPNWGAYAQIDEATLEHKVLFTQMKLIDNVPFLQKQIILNEKLETTFLLGKTEIEVQSQSICSYQDLRNVLDMFLKYEVCVGHRIGIDDDILQQIECTYLDESTGAWRHRDCTFKSELYWKVCRFCSGLSDRIANYKKKMLNNDIIKQEC